MSVSTPEPPAEVVADPEPLPDRLFQLQCQACAALGVPGPEDRCSVCAEVMPQAVQARTAVQARRHAFKGAIGRLQAQARAVIEYDRFPKHPVAMADADYIQQVLQPAGDLLGAAETAVRRLLADNTWNPGEPASRAALEEVIRTVKGAIAEAERLREIMPPLAWRAVHRDLARSAAFTVKGLIEMVAVVGASDYGGAVAREQAAQQALEEAAVRLRRIFKTVAAMTRRADLWRPDGSIDLAKAAWASAEGQPMTITEAADVVREAFGQVPGVSDAADEHILGFLPILAVGAGVLDHDLVAAYAVQLRGVLDQADATGAWIVEPDLLLARYARAAESMVATTEQLVRAVNAGLPRRDIVKALTGVYLDQVEGPLRDLGTIILIAARAARGEPDDSTYREEVVEGIKAGEVVNELVHLGAPCSEAVAMIYRNAAAHASIEITDDGLKATSRRIAEGRVYEAKQIESTDAQFAEDVTALHELLFALQIVVIPWLGSHADPAVAAALASAGSRLDAKTRGQIMAMLCGLEGLKDVTVDGDEAHLTITVVSDQEPSHFSEHGTLKLVPAGFGASPDVEQVTLVLDGHPAVTYDRAEVQDAVYGEPLLRPLFLGLFSAKWLLESQGHLGEPDQSALVTLPLTDLHVFGIAAGFAEPLQADNLRSAAATLDTARRRLQEVVPPQARTELTARADAELQVLADAMRTLADCCDDPLDGGDDQRAFAALHTSVAANTDIGNTARAIRDDTAG